MLYIIVSLLLGFLSINIDSPYEKPVIESFVLSVNYHLDGESAIREMDGLPENLFEYRLDTDQIYMREYSPAGLDECLQIEGATAYLTWCTRPLAPECDQSTACFWRLN